VKGGRRRASEPSTNPLLVLHANRFEPVTHCSGCAPDGFVSQNFFLPKSRPRNVPDKNGGGESWGMEQQYAPHIFVPCEGNCCLKRAVAQWIVVEDPSQKWSGCQECQEDEFDGWPDGYEPVGGNVESFYNDRVSRRIFLVALSRFKAIVDDTTGTDLQKAQAGVAAFPGVVADNSGVTAGALLDLCNRGGGLGGVMDKILCYLT